MFRHEDMMAKRTSKANGSRLGRTETVSIRLDPRLNYLCELAARSQRRTKSSFIEAMLAEHIHTLPINKWQAGDYDGPGSFGDQADVLWHVRESQRIVSLGIIAPELLTFEEQEVWALIKENGLFWRGRWKSGVWGHDVNLETILRGRVDDHWEDLLAIVGGEKSSDILPAADVPAPEPKVYDDEIPF